MNTMNLSQGEYLERLVLMLPEDAFVGKSKLVLGPDCVYHSAQMVRAIANEMFKCLSQYADTDLNASLKDAVINLAVLGEFLTISYSELFGGK